MDVKSANLCAENAPLLLEFRLWGEVAGFRNAEGDRYRGIGTILRLPLGAAGPPGFGLWP